MSPMLSPLRIQVTVEHACKGFENIYIVVWYFPQLFQIPKRNYKMITVWHRKAVYLILESTVSLSIQLDRPVEKSFDPFTTTTIFFS